MANIITFNNRLIDYTNAPYVSANTSTLNTGLLAYYKGENNVNDSLGLYDGTAQGGLTYVAGKSGNAFNGNGTNAYLSLPDNLFKITTDLTISFWDNPNALSTDIIFGCYNAAGTRGWSIYHGGSGRLRFYQLNSTGVQWIEFNTSINSGSFKNFIFIKTLNSIPRCLQDGVEMTVNASSGTLTLNPSYDATQSSTILAAKLGATVSNYSNHKIDEIGIWTKTLNSTEITELQTKFYPFT